MEAFIPKAKTRTMKRSYLGIFLIILGLLLLVPMGRGLYDYAVMGSSVMDDTMFGIDWVFFHFLMGIASILLIWVGIRYVKLSKR